ncbi:MAG: bifunctional 4-hydroxy-2-oxoglutarate aldolase/2-dehydro-3-deoxy-phosphogluconate aldolase [Actinomycetota bacterium]|jgi:2-dehydro-3-deoxyphosphogluconate aldolase/(4S)-4-hydroxy-2-oxoglutarate aldolase
MARTLITFETLEQNGLVPVVVSDDLSVGIDLLKLLKSAGITCVEIALRTSASVELLGEAKQIDGLIIGAGTVLNKAQLDQALEAGSDFIVTPGLSDQVIDSCVSQRVPVIPGVATATEVMRAIDKGLSRVKLFPAETLGGLGYIKALSGPFPDLKFMPSGGLNGSNFAAYMKHPNVFSVSGSWMLPKNGDMESNLESLKSLALEIETLRQAK